MSKPDFRKTLEVIVKTISEQYSFLCFKQKEFFQFKTYMNNNINDTTNLKEFFEHATFALSDFSDLHLYFTVPRILDKTRGRSIIIPNLDVTNTYLSDSLQNGIIKIAKIDDVTYLRIDSFGEEHLNNFEWLMRNFPNNNKFVIDLRVNGGGVGRFSQKISEYLLGGNSVKSCYSRKRINPYNCTELSDFSHEYLKPENSKKNKVIILTSEDTCSAAELATLRFRAIPNSKIVGTTTYGALSGKSIFYNFNETFSDLIHIENHHETEFGLRIPTGLIYTPSKILVQDNGIQPDFRIDQNYKALNDRDLVLEKSLEIMKQ